MENSKEKPKKQAGISPEEMRKLGVELSEGIRRAMAKGIYIPGPQESEKQPP